MNSGAIFGLVLVAVGLFMIAIGHNKATKFNKIKNRIYGEIRNNLKQSDKYTFKTSKRRAFDYVYEDDNNILYIKLITNADEGSIVLKSNTKWVYLNHNGTERKVEDVLQLLRLKNKKTKKNISKIYLIYKNVENIYKMENGKKLIMDSLDNNYGYRVCRYSQIVKNRHYLDEVII